MAICPVSAHLNLTEARMILFRIARGVSFSPFTLSRDAWSFESTGLRRSPAGSEFFCLFSLSKPHVLYLAVCQFVYLLDLHVYLLLILHYCYSDALLLVATPERCSVCLRHPSSVLPCYGIERACLPVHLQDLRQVNRHAVSGMQ